uniref:Uncharacterized protein n=1 Tax=Arundo donax TaxID=35708 RepID=A0A0A9CGK1_ARUDO
MGCNLLHRQIVSEFLQAYSVIQVSCSLYP